MIALCYRQSRLPSSLKTRWVSMRFPRTVAHRGGGFLLCAMNKDPQGRFLPIPPEIRFWKLVSKSQDCWNWTGFLTRDKGGGYGLFRLVQGKETRAHRYSWTLHNGQIPDGLWVLHKCDNRKCVNPEHLYLGTHDDNMRDGVLRKRFRRGKKPDAWIVRGEGHGRSILTNSQVLEIRMHCAERKLKQSEIAVLYGVKECTINEINTRKSWKHI